MCTVLYKARRASLDTRVLMYMQVVYYPSFASPKPTRTPPLARFLSSSSLLFSSHILSLICSLPVAQCVLERVLCLCLRPPRVTSASHGIASHDSVPIPRFSLSSPLLFSSSLQCVFHAFDADISSAPALTSARTHEPLALTTRSI